MCLLVGDRLFCLNVGDSRALLSRNKEAVLLSRDHKPVVYCDTRPIHLRETESMKHKVVSRAAES